jgi:hypothetical protein
VTRSKPRQLLAIALQDFYSACFMKELISHLVSQADLTEEQASRVAEVVRGFLKEKLPEALRGPVDSFLTGQQVDNLVEQAKNLLGGFLKLEQRSSPLTTHSNARVVREASFLWLLYRKSHPRVRPKNKTT